MGQLIWPSHNDVGDDEGDGTILTEERVKGILGLVLTHPGVLEGFTPSNPSGLTVRVAAGKAFLDGHYIETDAVLEAQATASTISYQFLRLDVDGNGRATAVSLETRASPVAPSDRYAMVAHTLAGASSITTLYDERLYAGAGTKSGFYTGDGSSGRTISTGRTPTAVLVGKVDGSADNILALSAIEAAGQRRAGNSSLVPASRVWFYAGTSHTLPKTLGASKTWTAGSTDPGYDRTTDITVSGAAVGDPVLIWMEQDAAMGEWCFQARVISANTVRCYACNISSVAQSLNATVYVRVLDISGVTVPLDVANFLSAQSTDSKAPLIVPGGFTVSGSGTPNLNASGWNYGWLALF